MKHHTSYKLSKVFWNSPMLTSIILCLLNGRTPRIEEKHNKITYKFNDKSLDTDTNKSNTLGLIHLKTTVCPLLSHETLSVIAPIYLKLGLPDQISRWSFELVCKILKVPIFVRVFFILSWNLDLQSGVCCIK